MYIKKRFGAKDMLYWTRKELLIFTAVCIAELLVFKFTDHLIQIPFTPVALLGTAVAFIIGFQTNSAYGRAWEARKIWGAIVNSSRTFGMMTQNYVSNAHRKENVLNDDELHGIHKKVVHRHIAWLTALRYAMRQPRPWEYILQEETSQEWSDRIYVPEFQEPYEETIRQYISDEDWDYIKDKSNHQTALLYLQTEHLTKLKEEKLLWEFSYLEIENVVEELFTHQGKSERIKNFPYPRQFASMLYYITLIFLVFLPLGMASQFDQAGHKLAGEFPGIEDYFYWFSIPFSVIVMWIFNTMNRIGRVGENPFEGTPNDVPISAIARGIEIDMRQNLGEAKEDIPAPFEIRTSTQM